MKEFWLCFVPLFVAVDAIGVLPLYLGLTEGIAGEARRKAVIVQSLVTAAIVAAIFILFGNPLLGMLGITVSDFMVAGGVLLFVISLVDILGGEKLHKRVDATTVGAVPIGVPLITGPAVLTTSLLLVSQHGELVTLAAAFANVLLAGMVFWFAGPIARFLGSSGTKTVSKIAHLVLAAIGVMMVRKGIQLLTGWVG